MWLKKNKWKVIIPLLIAAVLAAAFFFGGKTPETAAQTELSAPAAQTAAPEKQTETAEPAEKSAEAETEAPARETETDAYLTEAVPEGKPAPVEPQEAEKTETEYSCTISISCETILGSMELCDPDKRELVPPDGCILAPTEVTFREGESVFDVLQRVCRENRIHLEFENTPLYNSAYIEGIYNLYELDVGELSGWMYSVNGWFPNYGCSRYGLADGDVICWVYTCDLGDDVGGGYAAG